MELPKQIYGFYFIKPPPTFKVLYSMIFKITFVVVVVETESLKLSLFSNCTSYKFIYRYTLGKKQKTFEPSRGI